MALRIFDMFNAKIGSNTVAGPQQAAIDQGFSEITAESDGAPMLAARDRDVATATLGLTCQDVGQFATHLATCEGALASVQAEGREVGADTASRITASYQRLIGASLDLGHGGGYATTRFDFRTSWPSAAVKLEDAIAVLNAQTKTIAVAGAKRAFRIKSAAHGATTVPTVIGLSLAVKAIGVETTVGDDDFGEVVEVGAYDVSGTLTFQDLTVAAGKSASQTLLHAAQAALVIPLVQQGQAVVGGSVFTLTIANVKFLRTATTPAARKYGVEALQFGTVGVVDTTQYNLATGANKVITIA